MSCNSCVLAACIFYCLFCAMAAAVEIVEINDSLENVEAESTNVAAEVNDVVVESENNATSVVVQSIDVASVSENNNSPIDDASSDDVDVENEIGDRETGEIEFQFTVGSRERSELIFTIADKQLYKKERTRGKLNYYRCKEKSCLARLVYDSELNKCTRKKIVPHEHGNQEKTERTAEVRKIIRDECKQMSASAKRNKTSVDDVIHEKIRE